MDLADAAGFFDELLCFDAFLPARSFYGQMDLFDDSRRDGTTVARRVLSVRPNTIIPAKRVIRVDNEYWIIGSSESDYFQGSAVRQKYVVHRADGPALIQSANQLGGSTGSNTYAAAAWIKDLKEFDTSSRFEGFYNVYLPKSERALVGDLLTLNNDFYRVRNSFVSTAGFLVAESDKLPADMVVSAVYTQSIYNPASDTYSSAVNTTVSLIIMRWQDNFRYDSEAAEKYVPGDVHGVLAKTALVAPPAVGNTLSFSGRTWEVISIDDELSSWGLHLRTRGS
jgi:hypothetical protein